MARTYTDNALVWTYGTQPWTYDDTWTATDGAHKKRLPSEYAAQRWCAERNGVLPAKAAGERAIAYESRMARHFADGGAIAPPKPKPAPKPKARKKRSPAKKKATTRRKR